MGTYFPQELIDKVVDHLRDDKESLLSCSLIARSFQHSSRKGLFYKIKVKSWDDTQRLQDFTKFLSSKPPVAKYIQELELSGGMITRLETTMSMGTLCSILTNVPNVHSLSLIGFGWSSSGEHAASPNDAFPPLSLRKLSINYFTIQCSEIDSQFQQLLDLCSLFGTVGEFTVDQLWASGGRLDEPTYETIREWIEQAKQRDPSLVEKFQVSSLEVNADYINASFIMELIRNTSSPEHLSLHPSTIVEASTARALIAHSILSLASLTLNVTYEYEEADQAQLNDYAFDLSKCENLKTLRYNFGAEFPVVVEAMQRSLEYLSDASNPPPIRDLTLQVTLDQETLTPQDEDEILEYVNNVGWNEIDTFLTSENFEGLEKVTVDLSGLRFNWDEDESEEYVTNLEETVRGGLGELDSKGLLTITVDKRQDEV